jgi:hypothetical protein
VVSKGCSPHDEDLISICLQNKKEKKEESAGSADEEED